MNSVQNFSIYFYFSDTFDCNDLPEKDLHDFHAIEELFCTLSLEDKSKLLECDDVTASMAEELLETLSVCSNGIATACEHSPYDVIDYNSKLSSDKKLQQKMADACDDQCVRLKKVVKSNIEYAETATFHMMDKEIQELQKNETWYDTLSQLAEIIDKEVKDELGISEDVENDLEKELSISRDGYRAKLFSKIDASNIADEDKTNLKAASDKGSLDMNKWTQTMTIFSMSRYKTYTGCPTN